MKKIDTIEAIGLLNDQMKMLNENFGITFRESKSTTEQLAIIRISLIGLGRVLNVPPSVMADCMINYQKNAEYEAEVTKELEKILGRNVKGEGKENIIKQEVNKRKKKA